jgi:hypothetical protein
MQPAEKRTFAKPGRHQVSTLMTLRLAVADVNWPTFVVTTLRQNVAAIANNTIRFVSIARGADSLFCNFTRNIWKC